MKNTLICTLLLATMSACGGEKKEDTAVTEPLPAETTTMADSSQQEVSVTLDVDTAAAEVQQKSKEIDSLLEGI